MRSPSPVESIASSRPTPTLPVHPLPDPESHPSEPEASTSSSQNEASPRITKKRRATARAVASYDNEEEMPPWQPRESYPAYTDGDNGRYSSDENDMDVLSATTPRPDDDGDASSTAPSLTHELMEEDTSLTPEATTGGTTSEDEAEVDEELLPAIDPNPLPIPTSIHPIYPSLSSSSPHQAQSCRWSFSFPPILMSVLTRLSDAVSSADTDRFNSLVLDLIGWGVPPSYLVKSGVNPNVLRTTFEVLRLRAEGIL